MTMETRIKHVAICTENYDRMAEFYKTVFGMKKITNGMTDATGNYDPERGHISDGLIGYALLQRQPGITAGLDHFGFEVDDVSDVLEKLAEKYPDILVSKPWTTSRSLAFEPTIQPATNSIFHKIKWPTCARATKKVAGSSRAG